MEKLAPLTQKHLTGRKTPTHAGAGTTVELFAFLSGLGGAGVGTAVSKAVTVWVLPDSWIYGESAAGIAVTVVFTALILTCFLAWFSARLVYRSLMAKVEARRAPRWASAEAQAAVDAIREAKRTAVASASVDALLRALSEALGACRAVDDDSMRITSKKDKALGLVRAVEVVAVHATAQELEITKERRRLEEDLAREKEEADRALAKDADSKQLELSDDAVFSALECVVMDARERAEKATARPGGAKLENESAHEISS